MALREAVWDQMLDAQMRQRYYAALFDRFHLLSRLSEIIATLASAGAAATWVVTQAPEIAAALAALSAATVTIQSALKLADQRAGARSAVRHWERRARAWEALWLEVESGDPPTLDRFRLEQAHDVDWADPEIRTYRPLLVKAEKQVHQALRSAA